MLNFLNCNCYKLFSLEKIENNAIFLLLFWRFSYNLFFVIHIRLILAFFKWFQLFLCWQKRTFQIECFCTAPVFEANEYNNELTFCRFNLNMFQLEFQYFFYSFAVLWKFPLFRTRARVFVCVGFWIEFDHIVAIEWVTLCSHSNNLHCSQRQTKTFKRFNNDQKKIVLLVCEVIFLFCVCIASSVCVSLSVCVNRKMAQK